MSDDDWEAEFDREVEQEKKALAAAKAAPAAATPVKKDLIATPAGNQAAKAVDYDIASADPIEQRRRLEKKIEEEERRLAGDLFEGCELTEEAAELIKEATAAGGKDVSGGGGVHAAGLATIGIEALPLKNLTDATKLAHLLGAKIDQSEAKSVVWREFLTTLFSYCFPKMNPTDLKTFKDKVSSLSKEADASRRLQLQGKKKVNEEVSHKVSHYKDEYDMMFGDVKDKYDYSEEEEGDEDDFMA